MKKIYTSLLILLLALTTMATRAEAIKSADEVAGTWLLEYTTQKLDTPAADGKRMDITWVLKDGKLIQEGIPQARGDTYNSEPVDYVVEEGLLKVSILGRAGKFDTYSLEKRTDREMVLKDTKFGSFLHFTKK